jgi:ATP-dependent RNA helicase DDX23/PRP28
MSSVALANTTPVVTEVPVPKRDRKPMDVEDLLKKKQQEEQDSVKPKFLTKEERERLALERRAQQAAERISKLEDQRKQREEFFQEASKLEDKSKGRDSRDTRDKDNWKERRDRDREREARDKEKEKDKEKDTKDKPAEKELEIIKNTYLGAKKEKKKIIKPSEKFKFVFDWDITEDTSRDVNPLYNTKHEIRPQFGRGYIAGIDPKEQTKDYKKFLQNELKETAKANASETLSKKLSTLEKAEMPARHWSDKSLDEMTERDWRIFKEDFNISTKGGNIPHPIRKWKEAKMKPEILEAIERVGYKTPTPIQMQAIPIALQGRDIMGIAETGSGKTAAFVLPMLEYILNLPRMTPELEIDGPYALVMAPTRELVMQIEQECSRFASLCGLRTVAIVGGVNIDQQAFQLRKGCEIVIATPGRLNDMIESRYIVLNQCLYIVLDEADRMIDMGFEPQVNSVLEAMPATNLKSENEDEAAAQEGNPGRYRTTIMYSATMPAGVERLSRKFLRRPAYVIIGEVGKAVDRIEQRIEWAKDENDKRRRLTELLTEGPPPPIIIFLNKKTTCDSVAKQLEKQGWRAVALHSGRNQLQREAAIDGFRNGRYDILIATDVAGRGIDVPGITHVINFDMPKSIEDYTHRIGRTARAGASGLATSFLTNDDSEVMYDLKQMLQHTNQFIPNELANHPAAQVKPGTVTEKPKARKDTVIYAK